MSDIHASKRDDSISCPVKHYSNMYKRIDNRHKVDDNDKRKKGQAKTGLKKKK